MRRGVTWTGNIWWGNVRWTPSTFSRSSRLVGVLKKVVLKKSFAKFTRKHPCQGLVFNKVAGFWPAILVKKTLRGFPVNFANFLRKEHFLIEHLRWLLLHVLRKQCSIKIDGRLKQAVPQNNCSSVAIKIIYFCITEAVARRCSVKKVFLENSQRLQQDTCWKLF